MHFIITGHDGTDAEALDRRMNARIAHLAQADTMREQGKLLMAVAMLDEAGQMCGSTIVASFEDRNELEEWLKVEPYVVSNVWQRIEVAECRVAPSFLPSKVEAE